MNRLRLSEVSEFVLDGTHGSPARVPSGVPVLSAQNVVDGRLDWTTERFTTDVEYQAFRRRLDLKRGDVLLTIVGTIGRAAVVDQVRPAVFQRSVAVLRPKPARLDSSYLYYALGSADTRRQLMRMTNQSSQAGVYLGRLAGLELPTPNLKEQRRIAALLDKADAIRRKRRESLPLLDEFLRSAFLKMFGDPVRNEKGWQTAPLAHVTACLDGQRVPVKESERRLRTGRVPYYGANGQVGWIDQALFDEPLLLIAEDGGHFEEPRKGVAYSIEGPAWVNNHAHVLRPDPSVLDLLYLEAHFHHYNFLPYITGTTRSKLTQSALNRVPVMIPPLQFQRDYRGVAQRVRTLSAAYLDHEQGSDRLFDSLAQRAFGEGA